MKKRLDDILVELNYFKNKSASSSNIKMGNVLVNNLKITKAGTKLNIDNLQISIIDKSKNIFVSRAGLKLDKAIKKWNLNIKNKNCLDIGSSTGGFTDCLLQNNAKMIYAVDVGSDQLHPILKENKKVISIEKFNFRDAKKEHFNKEIEFFCCDVSFISLKYILDPLQYIILENTKGVLLIKPQFELEKKEVIKGKVTNQESHIRAIYKVINYLKKSNFILKNIDFSPITGNKKGNIEYIALVEKNNSVTSKIIDLNLIIKVVNDANKYFKENLYEDY